VAYNPVQTLDESHSSTMFRDGQEIAITGKLYRCIGRLPTTDQPCGLVWDRFGRHDDNSGAVGCAARGHRAVYTVFYGKVGEQQGFTRKAIRRDSVGVTTPVSRPVAQVQTPQALPTLSVADLKALAAAAGYQLRKAPTPKASTNLDDGFEDVAF
jgi:hypothetical protein